jgi:hypothetical protein
MKCNVALLLLVAVARVGARSLQSNADAERPVMKIVRLLQDMQAELEKEKADDEAVFESLDCWCKTNEEEKTAAISAGEAKISDLKSSMGEFAAKIEELREGLATTKEKLRADQKALADATAIRMKEIKIFQGEETDLLGSIQSIKQALVVLSKHNPSFTQLASVAKNIQAMKTMQLAKDVLSRDKLAVVKAFLQEAQESSQLRRSSIPGFKSYTPQSGQIFGILQQMQEEFEASLTDSQKNEAKAKADFAGLKSAKEGELGAGRKQQTQLEQDDADFREKNAQAYEEFNDTEEQLKIDQTFLRNLQKKCSQSDATFEKRMKDRAEEIAAVQETIAILNSDDSFEAMGKTVNTFVQVSAKRSRAEQTKKHQAAEVLRSVRGGSASLAALAAAVELDGFEKAIAAIDKMVTDLTKQQKEEVEHKDWCQSEMQDNAQETAAKDDHKTNLLASISDLQKTIETLTKTIETNEKAIATMQAEMKKASEIREGENADFQQTVTDQRITQTILQKATDRMSQVYFLQQPGAPHIQTSGTHTDPGNGPAKFAKYEQKGGGKIVAMLDDVMADSKKMENEAIAGEQDAQSAYEMFMKDSNKSIKQTLRSNVNMAEEKAKSEEALSRDETDLAATMKTLESLNEELGDLHKSCDFVLNNFDKRQEARALEMDALREAKNILGGMK